jgi:exopolysaccharide production protein ExoQ
MRISYRALWNSFTLIVLFLSTGAFLSLIVDPGVQGSSEGSPLTQGIWAVVFLIVTLLAIPMYRQILPLVRANKCLCILVLLAIVSAAWSQDRVGTLRQGIALLMTTLFGIEIAMRYSIREQMRMACIVLGSVVVLSVATQLFLPGLVPQLGDDASIWQGAFGHKNTFGKIVVLAVAAFLSRPRRSRRDTILIVALVVIAAALVVASHSASSLVELAAIVLISWAIGTLRWRPSMLILAVFLSLLIAIPTVYLAMNNLDRVTAGLGRDSSLSGRTELWRLVAQSIASEPILGHGYGVFWEFSSQEATRIRGAIGWDAPSAHNGYLDLLLDVGLAGLVLYAAAYIVTVRRAIVLFRRGTASDMTWPLLLVAEIFLCQITEASVVAPHSTYWILYVAAVFSVSKPFIVAQERMREQLEPVESMPEAVLTEV